MNSTSAETDSVDEIFVPQLWRKICVDNIQRMCQSFGYFYIIEGNQRFFETSDTRNNALQE